MANPVPLGARWWQLKHFLFSSLKLGKMGPNLTSIFFRWVETTNQSHIDMIPGFGFSAGKKIQNSLRHRDPFGCRMISEIDNRLPFLP